MSHSMARDTCKAQTPCLESSGLASWGGGSEVKPCNRLLHNLRLMLCLVNKNYNVVKSAAACWSEVINGSSIKC